MEEQEAAKAVVASTITTKESMDELAALTERMTLEKKQRMRKNKATGDADMEDGATPKISITSKPIAKTRKD